MAFVLRALDPTAGILEVVEQPVQRQFGGEKYREKFPDKHDQPARR
ncbi:hypothetical protein [Salinisphaera sp.]